MKYGKLQLSNYDFLPSSNSCSLISESSITRRKAFFLLLWLQFLCSFFLCIIFSFPYLFILPRTIFDERIISRNSDIIWLLCSPDQADPDVVLLGISEVFLKLFKYQICLLTYFFRYTIIGK